MARNLDQILTELNSVYAPQKDSYNQQIQALDPAMQAEQQGLAAAKDDAFGQITSDANRRGLAFSGIPIAEQAKYTGSTYLPSVANLKSRYAQQRFNLQDALNNVSLEQRKYGQSLYDNEVSQDTARSAASAGSGFSPSFGGVGSTGVLGDTTQNYQARNSPFYNVFFKPDGSKWDDESLVRDLNATIRSAGYGNLKDQQKLQAYRTVRPDLFASKAVLSKAISNGQVANTSPDRTIIPSAAAQLFGSPSQVKLPGTNIYASSF